MTVHILTCGLGLAFLLEFPRGLFLIDCGSPGQHTPVLEKMKELRRTDLKLIWITHAHYDHYGSAAALRQLTGAPVGVHAADVESLAGGLSPLGTPRRYGFIYPLGLPLLNRVRSLPATPADFTLNDGDTLERFGLDATVLHTPGHTPGHTCVLLADGTAFAGDLVYNSSSPGLQHLLATDWSQLSTSLASLQAAHPERVYTGHSRQVMSGEVLQRITP
jgi:glyoxylase-like metal-dependent hydrolase (beta-lactamase superfamily II)